MNYASRCASGCAQAVPSPPQPAVRHHHCDSAAGPELHFCVHYFQLGHPHQRLNLTEPPVSSSAVGIMMALISQWEVSVRPRATPGTRARAHTHTRVRTIHGSCCWICDQKQELPPGQFLKPWHQRRGARQKQNSDDFVGQSGATPETHTVLTPGGINKSGVASMPLASEDSRTPIWIVSVCIPLSSH